MKVSSPQSSGRKGPAPATGVGNERTAATAEAIAKGGPGKTTGFGPKGNPWANLNGGGGAAALKKDLGS